MFDIGFSELVVIALVALIVIGPERLPRVARTLGILFGRMQRYVNDVKADIGREMELEELKKIQTTFQDAAKSVEESVSQVNQEVQATEQELNKGIEGTAESAVTPESSPAPADPVPVDPTPAAAEAPPSPQMDLALGSGAASAPAAEPAATPKT